jgi:hypothetical protein
MISYVQRRQEVVNSEMGVEEIVQIEEKVQY